MGLTIFNIIYITGAVITYLFLYRDIDKHYPETSTLNRIGISLFWPAVLAVAIGEWAKEKYNERNN